MREKAKALDQTIISRARQSRGNMDAIQRLELREQFAKVRADNDARLLAAFKRLYGSLSPEQQQIANQLILSAGFRAARARPLHRADEPRSRRSRDPRRGPCG
jgi:hypothetical protein